MPELFCCAVVNCVDAVNAAAEAVLNPPFFCELTIAVAFEIAPLILERASLIPVSYTHLTLPTIYSV